MPRYTRFAPAEIDQIKRMAADGARVVEIATALGRNTGTISAKLKKLGIVLPQRVHRLYSDEQVAVIKQMVAEGFGGPEIAHAIGVTRRQLASKLRAMNTRLRKPRATNFICVGFERQTITALRTAADEHGFTSANGLVRELVEQVVEDDLVTAILDAPLMPPKPVPLPKRQPQPQREPSIEIEVAPPPPQIAGLVQSIELCGVMN